MTGILRGGVISLAVFLCYLIGQTQSQGDYDGFGSLPDLGIGSSPVDLVFVVDTSQFSNTTESLDREIMVKTFMTSFLDYADVDGGAVKVAMVTFSTHPDVVFNLNSYSKGVDVVDAIFEADFVPGERNTADAIARVRSQVFVRDRADVPNVVLIIQSGKSDRNAHRTIQETDALKYAGANVFVVGYALDYEAEEEMNEIASKPITENTFLVSSVDELDIMKEIVFAQIFTRAEQSYNSPAAGSELLDVAFLVHFSNTMKRPDFDRVIEYMKAVIEYSAIDDDKVRVGAALFRKRGILLFDFNSFYSKDEVKKGIDKINYNYRARSASITQGLETVKNSLLVDSAGVRRDVPNLVILITDSNADTDIADTIKAAEQLKAKGTAIYTVGINVTYPDELLGLASSPGYTLIVNNTNLLKGNEYSIQEAFVALRAEGFPLVIPAFETTTTTSTSTSTTTPTTTTVMNLEELDLVIAIHVSHNIKIADVKKKLLPFITDIASAIDIESGAVRASVVVFGTDAKVQFDLKKMKKSKKLVKAVKKALKPKTVRTKGSDIANVLNVLQTDVLVKSKGDRTDVPNLVIVVTDSASNSKITDVIQESAAMKKTGTTVFAIGVKDADAKEIGELASDPTTDYSYTGKSYDDFIYSADLRGRLSKIKILENLKAAMTKKTDGKKPKTPKPPKRTKKPPKTTTMPPTTTKPTEITTTKPPTTTKPTEITTQPVTTLRWKETPTTTTMTITDSTTLSMTSSPSPTPYSIPLSEAKQADLVIAVHLSQRTSFSDFAYVQQFLKKLIENADVENGDVQLGLMFYAADPEVIFHINLYDDKEKMKREIDGLDPRRMRSSSSDASSAVALGRQMLSSYFNGRDDASSAIIFVTDSSSTANVDLLVENKNRALRKGIQIFAIGVDMDDKEELETLATSPDNVMMIKRFRQLRDAADELQDKILALSKIEKTTTTSTTTIKTTTETPTTTPEPLGYSTMGPSLTENKFRKDWPMGDDPRISTVCNLIQVDIIFLLDSSSSMGSRDFQNMKNFLKYIVSQIDISNGASRVGVYTFNSQAKLEFNLNTYTTNEDVIRAIDDIPQEYGNTNTAGALRALSEDGFIEANGDRDNMPNVAVLITDGNANVETTQTLPEAQAVKQKGIYLYAIAVKLSEYAEFQQIPSPPTTRTATFLSSFEALVQHGPSFLQKLCEGGRRFAARNKVFGNSRNIAYDRNCGSSQFDLVIILDSSTSVQQDNWDKVLRATQRLVQDIDINNDNVRIGVMIFSSEAEVVFHLNTYKSKAAIVDAVSRIPFKYGQTNTADALKLMTSQMFSTENGDRSEIPNLAIVITDGESNINKNSTIPEANRARQEGIQIYAIGIGLSATTELDGIAGRNENRYFIDNFDELDEKMESIYRTFCPETTTQPPTTVAITTPKGPGTPTITPDILCSSTTLDVVFVLDSSTSMEKKNFRTMLDATKAFISSHEVDNGNTRIGMLIYSTDTSIKFHLNKYRTEKEVLEAIDNIKYMAGSTNTAGAINVMRNEMFAKENGARKDASKIGIIITDGVSNINYHKTVPEAELARESGIVILAIGVGLSNTHELDEIAGRPENKLTINRFEELEFKLDTFFRSVCHACGHASFDIIFVLDISESVSDLDFQKLIKAIHEFASAINIDDDRSRMGLLVYNTFVIHLNSYSSNKNLLRAISNARSPGSRWPISEGITFLKRTMFSGINGDREAVPNIAVIITDGKSDFASRRAKENLKDLQAEEIRVVLIGIGVESSTEFYDVADFIATESALLLRHIDQLELRLDELYTGVCMVDYVQPECNLGNSDLVLVIDASTSVTQKNFDKQLEFAKDLIRNADIDSGAVRVGALIYSTDVKVQFQLNQYKTKAEVFAAVDKIPYIYGSTNTADAIETMANQMFTSRNGDRPDVDNTCIVITDGVSNINSRKTIPNAKKARAKKIHIYAVGIGLRNTRELDGIASEPASENSFNVQSFEDLAGLDKKIFSGLCPVEPVAKSSCGSAKTDLVFILDSSTSVTETNFVRMLQFCKDILHGADIDGGSVRVGAIVFSSKPEIQFHLNGYSRKSTLFDAIDEIPYILGSTNTADAIRTARRSMFTPKNGDRPGAENVIILLTDGVSNVNPQIAIMEAELATREEIHIYAIGIGLSDTRELERIASKPAAENSFSIRNFEELDDISESLFLYECEATPAPKGSDCGLSKVDVAIILDASTSVTAKNFDKMRTFAKDIVDKANVDSGSVRIGALIYSTKVEVQFHLKEYKTNAAVKTAIDDIPYIYGSTNSADALKTMHSQLFNARNGDRRDVPNIAFMITDGISNINSRRTIPEAENAQKKGIKVYAIGIGLKDTRELRGMASEPKDDFMFNVKEFDELTALVDTIFAASEAECGSEPPVANAGSDVRIQMPQDFVTLDGSKSTDDVEVVKYQWKQKSGDATNMLGENEAELNLYGLAVGEYVFTLTVTDEDDQSDEDDVIVIVKESEPPVANAGDDVTIQMPKDTVTLDGSKSTDDVAVVRYEWSQKSGGDVEMEGLDNAELDLNGLKIGDYAFTLTVYDADGQSHTDDVTVTVEASEPPVANAGDDVTIRLPKDTVALDGSKSTDDVAVVRYEWSKKSGGDVEVGWTDDVQLDLNGLQAGKYVFSLTVHDADGQSDTDEVTIRVKESEPPVANAGDDVTIRQPKDSVTLDGSKSTDDVAVVRYEWSKKSGGDVEMEGRDSAELDLNGLQIGEYDFTLTVYDADGQSDTDDATVIVQESDPPVAEAGRDVTIQMPQDFVTLDGSKSTDDVDVVRYEWVQKSGEPANMLGKDGAILNLYGLEVGEYAFTLRVFDADGQTDEDDVIVRVKVSSPPVADAGDDVNVRLPQNSATLDGTRSSDDVEVVRYQWNQLSGGDVTIEGPNDPVLELSDLQAGSYKFELYVYDADGQVDRDEVRVKVAVSEPPVADAGDDVNIQMPQDSVSLDGSKSSDDVEVVQYRWEQKSGEDVNMKGQDGPVLNVDSMKGGKYVFALTVLDADGQKDDDDVTVIVEDMPPKADAGDDINVLLPTDTVTLNGDGSSDDVAVVSYQWELDAGDGDVKIEDDDTASPTVSGLKGGTYTLKLTVHDREGQSDEDTVDIVVTAADKPPVARAGDDVTIQLPVNNVTLDGSRSSDDIRIARYRWRLRSGDKSALKLDGERSPILRLSQMKPGNYRFSLTVMDDQKLKDTDYVEVTVLPDNPPDADAGEDQTVQFPQDYVSIYGDQSTDDVRIVTYDWKLVSGDRSVRVSDPNAANIEVENLKPGDYTFELTVTDESGNQDTDTVSLTVLPEPTTPAPTEAPCGLDKTDVVFVVDASTSVTEKNFKKQLDFMKSIIEFADINSGSVRFGALIYSTEVEIQFHLDKHKTKDAVLDAVDNIPYIYGSTNTADGLKTMNDVMFSFRNGDRDDAPNVAIVITDGVSNINSRRTIKDAVEARDVGIHIYAVGIGLTDTRELDGIASEPSSENSFNVADFDQLSDLGTKIFTATCKETTTTTTTTPTTTTTVMTTTTTAPSTTPSCGLSKTDLIFILDASTSVTSGNFQKMLDFLKNFLKNADINSGSVRVGVNIYSTDVQIKFHLNDYTTENDVMNAIDAIPYIYGSTNTADALETMRDRMFIPSRGDRPDAPNICVLLTDGISNINSRRTIPEAEETRKKGIRLYVIGIGLTNTREVEGIASRPLNQNLFAVQDFDELAGLERKMFKTSCKEEEPDEPPVANAGRDLTIQLPDDKAILSGEKSTDDKAVVQYVWDQIRGPRVRIAQTDDPNLELNDLKEGVYEFELSVYDEQGQADTDRVVVTVLPDTDLPPRANAGDDVTIQLPTDSVDLDCTGSVDDKGIVDYKWEVTSRRSRSVRLQGEDSCDLSVLNLDEGTYTLTLTVTDEKGQTDSDSVTVRVRPARDEPPVANAGRDYEIQLPTDSVTLDGSKSTDDIGITSYRWTVVSGNTRGVDLSGERTDSLQLDDLQTGEYVVRLTVTDKSRQSDSDEARIVVKPRPARTSGYDVIFILDSSVSPREFRWMNDYARSVIREMSIDDGEFRVGYLIYSNGAYRQFDLDAYETKDDVLAAVDKVGYRPGSKNTAAAFKFARYRMFTPENGDRDFAKNYIIHLTGGARSNDPYSAATEACGLQKNNVGMFAVGFGEVSDTTELDASSSLPTEDYELVIRDENEIGELPGLMLYNLKNGSPRPSPCPEAPTTPAPTGECKATGDIVFILDSSGSVGQDNFYRVLNFTYDTLSSLDIDAGRYRVGVTTFSDTSRLDFNLNEFSSSTEMEKALRQVVYMYGNTHTAHALRRARLEMFTLAAGDRPDVPNVVVIITDGQSNVNHELTLSEARALKSAGVSIITVAVGFTSETSELVGLTSPPISENLIYVEDYEGLGKLKQKLIDPLCEAKKLCRNKPCQNGGECMDGIRSFVCICPEDFFGDTCNKRCGEPADVVIVLDSSNTVGEYNFGRLKEYSEHLVREMNKDACDINIGFLKYSSAAMVQVNLGMYTDTETNVRALDQISYSRGRANMAAAFRALRTEMFNGRNGDRSGARNIAYFLTDGTNDVNAGLAEPEAELTISSGIRIIPVGINLRERFELDNIAANQGINVIEINDEPALIENTDTILRPLYEGNDFCAEGPCDNGGSCMNEPFGFSCDCPTGFTGETCQRQTTSGSGGCTAKGDVVFAVDTSRYVTRSELKKVRRFLRSVVKRMRFKHQEFSVGMVQFTDWAKVLLDFNSGKSKKAVRSGIAGLRVHGGDPEPATALAKANYRIFNGRGEDRDKPDYLILITKSMRNELDILEEANKLKLHGTRVLGVGIGLTDDEQQAMESSVSMPYQQTAMFTDDVKHLVDIADRVVEYMCDDEDHCAENPCRNGGVCTRMGGDFYCECSVGYAGKFCENRCQARADVVFLLDSSGSVGHVDFRRVKQFVHNMVSDLQIGKDKTRIGLVTYSSKSRHGFYMSKYYSLYELQNAIAGIGYEYGDTNTASGLRLVRERYFNGANGDRGEIQNFLVVVTDGVSNIDPDQTIVEANTLKEQGVHVYAVGIGKFDPFEINSIASPPASQNAYILSDYTALSNISSSIIKATCRDPTACDDNPCKNGGICVPGINGPFCECRAGYRGEFCQDSCVTVKDIYFLMDSSDSVGQRNFQTALNFIASVAEEFSTEGSYNRFSLLTFSDDVQIVFSLGRYRRLPVLLNAIRFARYRPGNTNTAGALQTVAEIAVDALGDRYDAENIIFLITDGNGNVHEGTTVSEAEYLKDKGARIIPIAINMQDYSEIEQIATNKNDIFKVSDFSNLESILDDVIVTTCKNGNEITTGK